MSPKGRSGKNPFSEYERELKDYGKEFDRELESFRSEIENEIMAYEMLEDAADELWDAESYSEFERKLRKFERLSDAIDRKYGKRKDSRTEERKDCEQKDQVNNDSDYRSRLNFNRMTIRIPESYSWLRVILKELVK